VTDARHASNVACDATDTPRDALAAGAAFVFRVLAFFAGS
jgi:hypothetical protein